MVAAVTLEEEGLAGTGNGRGKCFTLRANVFRDLAPQFAFANCAGTDGRTLLQMPRRLATSPHSFAIAKLCMPRRECLTSNGLGATAAYRLADALHKSLLFCILI